MSSPAHNVFASVPIELRKELEADYHDIKQNYSLRKFKPSEMGGGHFCETVYRILEWYTDPNDCYTPLTADVGDFRKLQSGLMKDKQLHESIRFHLPNALSTIYDIRSRRGAAHKAKDVNPNFMDASLVVACADWVMAELVRMLHSVSTDEARDIVKSITTKKIPLIWEVGDLKRVLSPPGKTMSAKDKILSLLYSETSNTLTVDSLLRSTEYSNPSKFRNDVLAKLHKSDLLHYDNATDKATLSPLGIIYVEKNIPQSFSL